MEGLEHAYTCIDNNYCCISMNRNDAAMVYLSNTCIIVNIKFSLRITISKKVRTVELHTVADHACEVLR